MIPTDELQFKDVTLKRNQVFENEWRIGRVVLNSLVLDSVDAFVRLRDCPPEDAPKCTVIGEAGGRLSWDGGVPPGQARSFDEALTFRNTPPAKRLVWDYTVLEARAAR
jgi:hypothetical protein